MFHDYTIPSAAVRGSVRRQLYEGEPSDSL